MQKICHECGDHVVELNEYVTAEEVEMLLCCHCYDELKYEGN